MKYSIFIIIFIFVISCTNSPVQRNNTDYVPYKSSGFALIYNADLHKKKKFHKKFNSNDLIAGHNILKKNSIIKITNPENMKSIELAVSKKIDYSPFYKVIISKNVATKL